MTILSQDGRRAVVFENVTAVRVASPGFTKVVQGNFILGKYSKDETALKIVQEIYNRSEYSHGYVMPDDEK